ncbi:MAG: hypothetical protein KatS3mg033_0922 [Thermonema sp.]|uniref:hypothetical protein n=1 Tax=Thermonema sp. TaxID=2231181 RepID=UPI0021DE7224|nr:hypothetical protein [Thermonema sp.]GIV39122.1 MAG: hypothetical protein KatS3mg033_0922 [Thermonema sp.]
MLKKYLSIALLLSMGLLASCGGGEAEQQEGEGNSQTNGTTENTVDVEEALQKLSNDFTLLRAIPSPIQMTSLVQESGAKYDPAILHDANKAKNYGSDFKRALNVGVYSTDLGFAHLYGKNQDAIDYLVAIRDLSTGLKVDSYFDFERLKQLTESNASIDELLAETLTSLQTMKDGLEKENRGDITVLVVTGGWVEALYLGCHVAENAKNKQQLLEHIADQKVSLDNIVKLLEDIQAINPEAKALYEKAKQLQDAYANVSLKVETISKDTVIDGVPTVVQEDQSVELNFTEQDFQKIYSIVKEMRRLIVE